MIKRVVSFSNPAYLSLANRQLIARRPEESSPFASIPVEDLGVIVLDNRQITITLALLDALLAENAAVVTCDKSHMPVGLQLPLEGNTLQSERFTAQIDASLPLKKQLWQQTVQAKITNQTAILRLERHVETGNMQAWGETVRSGDPENLEARAAIYYWRNIFPEFTRFSRNPEGDAPNSLLNYGYAIVRAMTARSLVGAGLLPTLGIHHHNRYNAYCLADDIMEPYRPFVDRRVIDIIRKYCVEPESISVSNKEIKRELLSLPVADTVIDGKTRPMINAIEVTAVSLCQCFQGKRRRLLYPVIKE